MEEALVSRLIQAAKKDQDDEVRVLITPKGEGKYSCVGTIDTHNSSDTQLALRAIDVEQRSTPGDGPTYRFPRGCIEHVTYAGDVKGEASFWFIIEGNHSLTGVRINSDEFFKLNDRRNGGGWPSDFTDDNNLDDYVYLKSVQFDYQIVSHDMTISLDEINCCGERW